MIKIDYLTHIAEKYNSQAIMGAANYDPKELSRLGIQVISGVQFKDTQTVFNRKGGTTRRKKVGEKVSNTIGYIEERELVAQLAVNRFVDNQDNYIQKPYKVGGAAKFSYPLAELALKSIINTYNEDIFSNLFWGDEKYADSEDENKKVQGLYNGINTNIAKDMESGRISIANKNLIQVDAIDLSLNNDDETDKQAWNVFRSFYSQWSPALKRQKVKVLISLELSTVLQDAYANKNRAIRTVKMLDNSEERNWTVPEFPLVTFVPSQDYGKGDRMMAYTDGNLQYGVDSLNDKNVVSVKIGSDIDNLDVVWQIQSVQGTRVLNVNPSNFAMSTGTLTPGETWLGDYVKNTFFVGFDKTAGKVTINGENGDGTSKEYAAGTVLTLKATAESGYTFVRWSNGSKETQIAVTMLDVPGGISAIFKKDGDPLVANQSADTDDEQGTEVTE